MDSSASADERLTRGREGDLAGPGVTEAAGAKRDVVPAGRAVAKRRSTDLPAWRRLPGEGRARVEAAGTPNR
jgi:hypothetical protein